MTDKGRSYTICFIAKYRHSRKYQGREKEWIRRTLIRRDGATCRYCGKDLQAREITLDHLIARSLGGSDEITNLVLACHDCNQAKGKMSEEEYLALQGLQS